MHNRTCGTDRVILSNLAMLVYLRLILAEAMIIQRPGYGSVCTLVPRSSVAMLYARTLMVGLFAALGAVVIGTLTLVRSVKVDSVMFASLLPVMCQRSLLKISPHDVALPFKAYTRLDADKRR